MLDRNGVHSNIERDPINNISLMYKAQTNTNKGYTELLQTLLFVNSFHMWTTCIHVHIYSVYEDVYSVKWEVYPQLF